MVIVTGSGRSGTSTVAGVLNRLGLHVPEPAKPADENNPRGYYENMWVVQFHGQLLTPVPVRSIDARPGAAEAAAEVGADPEVRRQISEWLAGHLEHPRMVLKDPRAFWLHDAWRDVCAEHGVSLSYLVMLRHPLEVAKSRDTAYLSAMEEERRRERQIANIAAWCNSGYLVERVTRDLPRSFVRYDDLLADWRAAMAPTREQLGIPYDADLADRSHHPVDDFVDVKLRRSTASWEDSDVPAELQEIAERMWQDFGRLVDDPADPEARADLDAAYEHYVRYHAQSVAVAHDQTAATMKEVRAEVRANQAAQRRKETAELRAKVEELQHRVDAAQTRPAARLRRRAGHLLRAAGLRQQGDA